MYEIELILVDIRELEIDINRYKNLLPSYYIKRLEESQTKLERLQAFTSAILLNRYLEVYSDKDFEIRDDGKLILSNKEIHFNISHSEEIVGLAISRIEIGLDIEKIRKNIDVIVKKYFDIEDQISLNSLKGIDKDDLFTKLWTQYESKVKLYGNYEKSISQENNKVIINSLKDKNYYISVATLSPINIGVKRLKIKQNTDFCTSSNSLKDYNKVKDIIKWREI